MIFPRSSAKPAEMFPGMTRRTLAYGQDLLLAEFTYERGARAPLPRHPHEQSTYVVEGRLNVADIPHRGGEGGELSYPFHCGTWAVHLGEDVHRRYGEDYLE